VPLAKHVTAIIDASKQEVEVAAKAYYTAKVGSWQDIRMMHPGLPSAESHEDPHL
jgi:hypothetical protein